jgi:hypothetical protein
MLNLPVKNKGKTVEVVACDKCKCTWLTRVKINRYSILPQSLSMEPVPVHFEGDFNLLQCAACGAVMFPPVEGFQTASAKFTLYNEMSEEVAGSKEEADKRREGTMVEKQAKGTWSHIPDKRDSEK